MKILYYEESSKAILLITR